MVGPVRRDRTPPFALPAMRVYLIHAAVSAFGFAVFATLSSIYRYQQVGLTPLQLVLVGTVLEATVLLAELPTGVVADTISRRLSLLIGTVLIGLGFMLEGLVPVLAAAMLAQVVWGLGAAFESGAVEAWLSDEIGEAKASLAFLRSAQVRQGAMLAGIPVAAVAGGAGLGLPLAIGGAVFLVLAAFLALTMKESAFEAAHEPTRDPLKAAVGTLRRGVALAKAKPLMWTILAVAVFAGAASETFDRLWEARMIAGPGLPTGLGAPSWFAILAFVTAILGIGVTEAAHRALKRSDADGGGRAPLVAWLWVVMIVQAAAVALFGLAGRLDLAVAMYLVARVSGRLHTPLHRAWLNRELEPSTRATAFSAAGVADALGQVTGGPLLGLVAAAAGMPAAFVASALVLGPAAGLLIRSWRREVTAPA
jgi:MFS transporter, DHA3 family, tetracycline resistance protein